MVDRASNMKLISSRDGTKYYQCHCGRKFAANQKIMQNMIYNDEGIKAAQCPACECVQDDPAIEETAIGYAVYVHMLSVSEDRKSLVPIKKLAAIGRYHNMTDWAVRRIVELPPSFDYQKIEIVKLTEQEFDKLYEDAKETQMLEGLAALFKLVGG